MLPRIDVSFASVDMSYDELVEIFLEEQYSRLPVYEESKDNVIGILNLKDLFFTGRHTAMKHLTYTRY